MGFFKSLTKGAGAMASVMSGSRAPVKRPSVTEGGQTKSLGERLKARKERGFFSFGKKE